MELREVKGQATFWADYPVVVIVAHQGRGVRRKGYLPQLRAELKEFDWLLRYLTPKTQTLNTPNGKVRFQATFEGLPVARYQPFQDPKLGAGALLATPGGTVLKVFPEIGRRLPESLHEQAQQLGLAPKPEAISGVPLSREREDLSTYINVHLGVKVKVRQTNDGKFLVAGTLDEAQRTMVMGLLRAVKTEEDAQK